MLTIGFHTHKYKHASLNTAIQSTYKIVSECFDESKSEYPLQFATQFNICNNRTGVITNWKQKTEAMQTIKNNDWNVFAHSPYVHGLWKGEYDQIIEYLRVTKDCGAWGLVFHIPKKTPEEISKHLHELDKYIEEKKIDRSSLAEIILEHHVIKPCNESYELPQKLNRLFPLLSDLQWSWCIDTAHLWSSISQSDRKTYAIETHAGFFNWLDGLSPEMVSRLKCIHFNGSKKQASCNKDEHEIPIVGENDDSPDQIWGNINIEQSSLPLLLSIAYKHKIPLVMEINSGTQQQVKKSMAMVLKIFNKHIII